MYIMYLYYYVCLAIQFSIPESEAPYITSADRIGWTFEGDTGPISSKFDPNHQSWYLPIVDLGTFPKVGDDSEFVALTMPRKFAVQIGIKEGKSGLCKAIYLFLCTCLDYWVDHPLGEQYHDM